MVKDIICYQKSRFVLTLSYGRKYFQKFRTIFQIKNALRQKNRSV